MEESSVGDKVDSRKMIMCVVCVVAEHLFTTFGTLPESAGTFARTDFPRARVSSLATAPSVVEVSPGGPRSGTCG